MGLFTPLTILDIPTLLKTQDFGLVALAFLLSGYVVYILRYRRMKARFPLPPGPPGTILLGNLTQMGGQSKPLWEQYFAWSKQYGPVVHLDMGGKPWIILNDAQSILGLLEKRSRLYSDRPHDVMTSLSGLDRMILRTSSQDKKFAVYRKIMARELGPGIAPQHWPLQTRQIYRMLQHTIEEPERFMEWFGVSSASTASKLVYGYDLKTLKDPFVQSFFELLKLSGPRVPGRFLVDSFPILRFLPSWAPGASFKKYANDLRAKLDELALRPVEWTKGQISTGSEYPSLASRLLAPDGMPKGYGEDHVAYSTVAVFAGGVDTTSATLEMLPLHLMMNPSCQARAQAEVDSVLKGADGTYRLPTMEDRDRLPYIGALVKELLRYHPIATLGLPHSVIQDDEYEGMLIPKGSTIVANIWAVLHDESIYPDPFKFDPERFLGPTEKQQTNPTTFAFGFGRRVCPGMHFAQWSLFLSVASLIAVFDFSIPEEDGKPVLPTVEFTSSTVVSHIKPYKCSIKPRGKDMVELVRGELERIDLLDV